MLLRPVDVARRRPEIAEGAHVKAACLIDGPPGDIAKALDEAVRDFALRKDVSGIQPADVEGSGPSLEVFVRAEIREVHSVGPERSGRRRKRASQRRELFGGEEVRQPYFGQMHKPSRGARRRSRTRTFDSMSRSSRDNWASGCSESTRMAVHMVPESQRNLS